LKKKKNEFKEKTKEYNSADIRKMDLNNIIEALKAKINIEKRNKEMAEMYENKLSEMIPRHEREYHVKLTLDIESLKVELANIKKIAIELEKEYMMLVDKSKIENWDNQIFLLNERKKQLKQDLTKYQFHIEKSQNKSLLEKIEEVMIRDPSLAEMKNETK